MYFEKVVVTVAINKAFVFHFQMKFIDAILSNNSTDDHCREFISLGGVPRLLRILEISYLPLDHPVISAAQAVSTVCKSILVCIKRVLCSIHFKIMYTHNCLK